MIAESALKLVDIVRHLAQPAPDVTRARSKAARVRPHLTRSRPMLARADLHRVHARIVAIRLAPACSLEMPSTKVGMTSNFSTRCWDVRVRAIVRQRKSLDPRPFIQHARATSRPLYSESE